MITIPKLFLRTLTREERKQLKEFGECGTEIAAPLFCWKASKGENECRFIEVEKNDLFETPSENYIALSDGIIIAVASNTGLERTLFFECKEYLAALDFYAKMVDVLKNCNN